jgi:hypothetical protein
MDFGPLNMTEFLVAAMAVVAVITMLRKRYDSNIPLLFYFIAVVFTNLTDREVNPFLLYAGLAFALLLRFEFLSSGFSKMIAIFATGSMCIIIYVFFAEILGDGSAPF